MRTLGVSKGEAVDIAGACEGEGVVSTTDGFGWDVGAEESRAPELDEA